MTDLLPDIGNSANFGLDWPTWISVGGFTLFCLLGLYATLLLLAGKHLPPHLRFLQLPSLRGRMLLGFVLAATLPAISLALVLSERATNERLESTAAMLKSQGESAAEMTDFFLQRYVAELDDTARAIQPRLGESSTAVEQPMKQAHQMMTNIGLVMAVDESGLVIATTRKTGSTIESSHAHDQTRLREDYFLQPVQTGEPYVSNGLRDPNHPSLLSAAISVPIIGPDSDTVGALIGFYDLGGLSRAHSPLAEHNGIRTVVLDRAGQVMFASANSGLSTEHSAAGHATLSERGATEGHTFMLKHRSESSDSDRRYLAAQHTISGGWQLLVYRPLDEIETALLDEYAVALAWLLGALVVSACLALAIVHSLSDPLESLDESVRNFDLNMNQEVGPPPADAPREVLAIFEHLGSLDKRLRATYRKLRNSVQAGEKLRGELIYVIANREKEIEQRTEELKEANQTLERLTREDSLTGLANRRWFAEFLARAWQGALREETPLSILIIDIDNFKAYNDTYGHQKGDACLKLVAEAIRRTVGRASDLVS
ncbi:MAG: diguanylate cyclase, partial [Gammaproteobacteria bacterium]